MSARLFVKSNTMLTVDRLGKTVVQPEKVPLNVYEARQTGLQSLGEKRLAMPAMTLLTGGAICQLHGSSACLLTEQEFLDFARCGFG